MCLTIFLRLKLLFLLLVFLNLKAQKDNSQFDSLIIKQPEKMLSQNISRPKIINWNLEMLNKAKREGYQKGIIWAKINLGIQYYNLAKPDISLKYLNEAKILADDISADNETYAKIFQEFSQVYFTLGLYDISLKYNSKGIYYGKMIMQNNYKKWFLSFAYNSRAGALLENKQDSSLFYLHKSASVFVSPTTYSAIAGYYIKKDVHLDSAKLYLNKAEIIFNEIKNVNPYNFSVLYYRYACLFAKDNRNDDAIRFLEKSLSYASNGKNRQHLLNVYNLLATTYRKVGDVDKEKKILEEYKKFNDFYKDTQAKSVDFTIRNLEQELLQKENTKNKKKLIYSAVFLILMFGLLYFMYFKNKNKISDQKHLSDEIVKVKSETKSANAIDELYESAKSRSPNFHNQFQNLYPDFFKNLTELNSDLQKNELHILAYIYLNFETKEIADILFLSPKTIQNKKHNIRKKLNIQSTEDMYVWLKTFYQ